MFDKALRHSELCEKLSEIYKKKNHDYGDSFGKSFSKYGMTAAMIRLEDKWNRLDNLSSNGESIYVTDEPLEDTLLDLANYCLMTSIELEIRKEKYEESISEYEENC